MLSFKPHRWPTRSDEVRWVFSSVRASLAPSSCCSQRRSPLAHSAATRKKPQLPFSTVLVSFIYLRAKLYITRTDVVFLLLPGSLSHIYVEQILILSKIRIPSGFMMTSNKEVQVLRPWQWPWPGHLHKQMNVDCGRNCEARKGGVS